MARLLLTYASAEGIDFVVITESRKEHKHEPWQWKSSYSNSLPHLVSVNVFKRDTRCMTDVLRSVLVEVHIPQFQMQLSALTQ